MIKFGPAGNSDAFYDAGYKSTWQQMEWLHNMGLDAYEYSFGKGVKLGDATAAKIADEADRHGITLSCHAPYYINLATDDPAKMENNLRYIRETCAAAEKLGAKRVVVHPGALMKHERGAAHAMIMENLKTVLNMLEDEGFSQTLCMETMGKVNQMGSLEEVIDMCAAYEALLPTIDFGHLYARTLGGIAKKEDYVFILDSLFSALGERARRIHVHFSMIEYTGMGEKRHLTFDDNLFGPDFRPLMEEFARRKMEPVVICESKGTMAKDALAMKKYYEECVKNEQA